MVKETQNPQHTSEVSDTVLLINRYASTWSMLNAYDNGTLPTEGSYRNDMAFTAKDLRDAIASLKNTLLQKQEATEVFAMERAPGNIDGIVGNIFQSDFGQDVYPANEEKAAHLFYFIVKNHPFVDGNKRCGAFAFIWSLREAGVPLTTITPQALTTLSLLMAESRTENKDNMVGLILSHLGCEPN